MWVNNLNYINGKYDNYYLGNISLIVNEIVNGTAINGFFKILRELTVQSPKKIKTSKYVLLFTNSMHFLAEQKRNSPFKTENLFCFQPLFFSLTKLCPALMEGHSNLQLQPLQGNNLNMQYKRLFEKLFYFRWKCFLKLCLYLSFAMCQVKPPPPPRGRGICLSACLSICE